MSYDTLTGRPALKNPTVDETRAAKGEDGKSLVKLTRAEREAARKTEPKVAPGLALNTNLSTKALVKRSQFEPPFSYIETGCYVPPHMTKKEAEAFYAPPEGLRGRLILA